MLILTGGKPLKNERANQIRCISDIISYYQRIFRMPPNCGLVNYCVYKVLKINLMKKVDLVLVKFQTNDETIPYILVRYKDYYFDATDYGKTDDVIHKKLKGMEMTLFEHFDEYDSTVVERVKQLKKWIEDPDSVSHEIPFGFLDCILTIKITEDGINMENPTIESSSH